MRITSMRALSRTLHRSGSRSDLSARVRRGLGSVLFVFAFSTHATAEALRAGVFDPPRAAPDFALNASDGSELKLSRYRGKVVALGFGYTHCPSVCPTTLAYLAEARKKLAAAGSDFQVIYVTVDPERDTAANLKVFLASFDPTFIGGTGTPGGSPRCARRTGLRCRTGSTSIRFRNRRISWTIRPSST